jgi:hypothetical protein
VGAAPTPACPPAAPAPAAAAAAESLSRAAVRSRAAPRWRHPTGQRVQGIIAGRGGESGGARGEAAGGKGLLARLARASPAQTPDRSAASTKPPPAQLPTQNPTPAPPMRRAAPEVLMGGTNCTRQVDIYSFGEPRPAPRAAQRPRALPAASAAPPTPVPTTLCPPPSLQAFCSGRSSPASGRCAGTCACRACLTSARR